MTRWRHSRPSPPHPNRDDGRLSPETNSVGPRGARWSPTGDPAAAVGGHRGLRRRSLVGPARFDGGLGPALPSAYLTPGPYVRSCQLRLLRARTGLGPISACAFLKSTAPQPMAGRTKRERAPRSRRSSSRTSSFVEGGVLRPHQSCPRYRRDQEEAPDADWRPGRASRRSSSGDWRTRSTPASPCGSCAGFPTNASRSSHWWPEIRGR